MNKLGILERLFLPGYNNTKQVTWASIKIDIDRCIGCGMCVRACPADSIRIENKKAAMKPAGGRINSEAGLSQCMGCGDCMALCPAGAIMLDRPYKWTRYFKTIDRGELAPPRL